MHLWVYKRAELIQKIRENKTEREREIHSHTPGEKKCKPRAVEVSLIRAGDPKKSQNRRFRTAELIYKYRKMLCSSWLLAAAVLCFHSQYVDGHCLDLTDCMGLKTNEQKLCIRQCRYPQESPNYGRVSSSEQQNNDEEVEEESLSLGLLLSALSPDSTELQDATGEAPHNDERRSYSMEHFRWGKPMGRKRRPVKVFTNGALEEDEPEESVENVRVERGQSGTLKVQQRNNAKTNGKYRMTHFRWNAPPDKRYGGFMRPYSDQSNKPLLTLIRNVIAKDGQQFRD
ncbi:proopiomelanocortin b isoform X2 [Labeo rohita]|uniref:proopiomelanocortin b isoform X2 n=1 Tax=Labeo rohita TaxID=84645 RepID=UPI0021E28A85|nr:proopiomelanocortin b isoform X2 [Labeo rohita]